MDICLPVLKESKKIGSTASVVRNSVLVISHIAIRDCRVHIFFPTTFLEIAVYETVSTKQRQESCVILSRNFSGPFFKLCMI